MIRRKAPPNKTRDFFKKVIRMVYFMGGQNYWYEDLDFTTADKLIHLCYSNIVIVASIGLMFLQWGVYFRYQNLTEKQSFDSKLFGVAHPLSFATAVFTENNKNKIADLCKRLVVSLKDIYNDETVEKKMIANSKFILKCYSFLIFMTISLYGVDGYMQVKRGLSFVTIVTAWPDVEDPSTLASIGRVAIFIAWSFLILRLTTVFIIVIPLTVCLSHQFQNLRSYFKKLNDIFKEDRSQEEKEMEYEKALKVGIQIHLETLRCVHQLQVLFNAVYSGQVIIKSTILMILMASMANAERTLSHVVSTLFTASYTLISLGCLWWTAGNISEEAKALPSAIFHSGWHNCNKKTPTRIRPLLVFAVLMSQRPVELKCLGFVTLSYQSYVAIVKSCYSGFSVLY